MLENSLEKPLAIIGDQDLVMGFRALGFCVYTAKNQQEFKVVLPKLIQENIAVCLIQENIYIALEDQINSYKYLPLPIFIPFSQEAKIELLDNLVKNIKLRATGVF